MCPILKRIQFFLEYNFWVQSVLKKQEEFSHVCLGWEEQRTLIEKKLEICHFFEYDSKFKQ